MTFPSPGPLRHLSTPRTWLTALAAAGITAAPSLASAQEPPPATTVQGPTQPPTAATVPTVQGPTQPPTAATVPTVQGRTQPPTAATAPTAQGASPPGVSPYPYPPGASPYPYPTGVSPYPYPPGAYPYPHPYPYAPPTEPLPSTLPYQEGRAGPPGYHLERHVRRRLAIPGASIFGGTWLLSIVTAAFLIESRDVTPLFFPIAGPFVTIHTADMNLANGEPWPMLALIFDGVTQTTGAALLVAGLVAKQPVWVRDQGTDSAASDSRSPVASALVPEVNIGPGTASFTWRY